MPTTQHRIASYLAQQPQLDVRHLTRLVINHQPLGWLEPDLVGLLNRFDPRFHASKEQVSLDAPAVQLETLMGAAARHLRDLGLIKVWRDELYAVHPSGANGELDTRHTLFKLERGAFRRFGFCSQAIHVNGLRQDRQIWLAQRASSKGIDPNRLDNIAAGGIPHDEDPRSCAIRELKEEAGIAAQIASKVVFIEQLRISRNEIDGTHDEVLHCYDLQLDAELQPINLDGEVAAFHLLTPAQCIERLPEMTWDAGRVMAHCLLRQSNHPYKI